MRESYFIREISKDSKKFIGDDGVLLGEFIVSSDSFFEDVHYKREWFELEEIARKSMLVNISDAIAMNATPKYAILNISLPKNLSFRDLHRLSSAFLETSREFGLKIVGGDTIGGKKLDISITILSEKRGKITKREGAKVGDVLFCTGEVGSVKKTLKRALLKENPKRDRRDIRFLNPTLRGDFFYHIAPKVRAALDVSDGISFEMERISKSSRVGFLLKQKMPRSMMCSGEEYELLFCVQKRETKSIKRVAKKYRVPLKKIATIKRGSYRCCCKPHHG